MTRLRIASLFVAVVTGDYAALTLIDGQLIDFGVTAASCAAAAVTARLMAYADNRRRRALARGVKTGAEKQCLSCRGTRKQLSDSPRFVDRQGCLLCPACLPAFG
jgi:hypothetical protein